MRHRIRFLTAATAVLVAVPVAAAVAAGPADLPDRAPSSGCQLQHDSGSTAPAAARVRWL